MTQNLNQSDQNKKTLTMVFGIVFAMIALSFASVPLYNLFCRVTGFGGTPQLSEGIQTEIYDRTITVQFNTDVNQKLAWDFKSEMSKLDVQIGQQALVNFSAQNTANEPTAGTAIYNVTPLKAGKYFNKIQCFCFDYQMLQPGEQMAMPVLFYLDPAIMDDPDMEDVNVITLSYSYFQADSDELDAAMMSQ